MCKAPKAPKVSTEKPEYLRNPFIDDADKAASDAIRQGRSSLTIALQGDPAVGFKSRDASTGKSAIGSNRKANVSSSTARPAAVSIASGARRGSGGSRPAGRTQRQN